MFRSLHMKLVLIMLLLITSLMAIVGAFLMTSITELLHRRVLSADGERLRRQQPLQRCLCQQPRARQAAQAGDGARPAGPDSSRTSIEAKAGDLGLNSQHPQLLHPGRRTPAST